MFVSVHARPSMCSFLMTREKFFCERERKDKKDVLLSVISEFASVFSELSFLGWGQRQTDNKPSTRRKESKNGKTQFREKCAVRQPRCVEEEIEEIEVCEYLYDVRVCFLLPKVRNFLSLER